MMVDEMVELKGRRSDVVNVTFEKCMVEDWLACKKIG